MPPADHSDHLSKARETVNQSRNEKQKAMLLREAARLGSLRYQRNAEESRKECDRAHDLHARRRSK